MCFGMKTVKSRGTMSAMRSGKSRSIVISEVTENEGSRDVQPVVIQKRGNKEIGK